MEQKQYFGQYGKILRIVVNNSKAFNLNDKNVSSYSAYITYSSSREAATAILAVDNTLIDNFLIRASFGSTKYCTNFLRNQDCLNKNCLFYHYIVNEKDIITKVSFYLIKEENTIIQSKIELAIKLADLANPETKEKLSDVKYQIKGNVLPLAISVYNKGYQILNETNIIECEKPLNKNSLKLIFNKNKNIIPNDIALKTTKDAQKESSLIDLNEISTAVSTASTRNSFTTSIISVESIDSVNNSVDVSMNLSQTCKKNWLQSKDRSRFNFLTDNTNSYIIGLPEGINDIINKKLIVRYSLRNIDIEPPKDYYLTYRLDPDWINFCSLHYLDSKIL